MNVLVLGANGYLGSKIVHTLIAEGHYLVCTKRVNSDLSRLSDLQNKEKLKMIPATVDAVDAVLQYVKLDWVLNVACNYGRSDVLYDSVIESNIEFPLKILNKVVMEGTKKFLTIGTGLPDDLNMYSFTKSVFSDFGKFYVKKQNIDFYNLRLEMFYGSDEPMDRFIPRLICGMLKGETIDTTIGIQCRDIIAVEDVEKAIIMVMNSDLHGYNEIPVGTGEAPKIAEIVNYIWENTGKKSKINMGGYPMRKLEPNCVADTSILCSIGAWEPVEWKKGLKRMIREIKEKEDYDGKENFD